MPGRSTKPRRDRAYKKWAGEEPRSCNLCGGAIVDTFVDGKTVYGPWAILDTGCHERVGVGLGTGLGQKYHKVNGEFVKVEG